MRCDLKTVVKAGMVLSVSLGSLMTALPAGSLTSSPSARQDRVYARMNNNPAHYDTARCLAGTTVVMTYFITESTSVNSATYYDEYANGGVWNRGQFTHYNLLDSDGTDYPMQSMWIETEVRVRANHYVNTRQGPACYGE
jgi:hypothetical protein